MACSNTEIVWALGCADRLVGVDSHSDFPPDVVSRLPRLGPDLEIDVDRVAALEPDLVLASLTVPGHETVVEGLELAGLPFLSLAPESLADVYDDVRRIAERLGVPERGEAVIREMEDALTPSPTAGLTGEASGPALPARILVQWWPRPTIAPGGRSWTDGVIRAAGARNVLEHEDRQSRPLSDEEVLDLAPDAIVVSWCGVDPGKYRPEVVLSNPLWQDLPAIRNRRVYCVPEAYLGRPGPRLVEGVGALREIVRELGTED